MSVFYHITDKNVLNHEANWTPFALNKHVCHTSMSDSWRQFTFYGFQTRLVPAIHDVSMFFSGQYCQGLSILQFA